MDVQTSNIVRKTYPVLHMTCASCAVSVESILKPQVGVIDASVNFATATVKIDYDPDLTSPEDLKKTVQSIGYDLLIDDSPEKNEKIGDIHKENFRKLKLRDLAIMLSVPVVLIAMFFMKMPYANFIMWALSTPVVLWFGRSFFINAWKQAKHRSANMDTLVALSTGVAYLFSVFNTIYPQFWHSRGIHAHVYFEAAAVVISFILLGKLLEEKAKGSTSSAIKKLMGLKPKTVTVVHEGGHQMEMPIESVNPGDIILVKPGEKIAVDGIVV
jgi:Cu2+-exporting ATPase